MMETMKTMVIITEMERLRAWVVMISVLFTFKFVCGSVLVLTA